MLYPTDRTSLSPFCFGLICLSRSTYTLAWTLFILGDRKYYRFSDLLMTLSRSYGFWHHSPIPLWRSYIFCCFYWKDIYWIWGHNSCSVVLLLHSRLIRRIFSNLQTFPTSLLLEVLINMQWNVYLWMKKFQNLFLLERVFWEISPNEIIHILDLVLSLYCPTKFSVEILVSLFELHCLNDRMIIG